MVLDILENAHRYLELNEGFTQAIEFLLRADLRQLPADKYEIDGERIFAMVSKGPGRKREGALLETHMQYIDIQLVLAGVDEMGWRSKSTCTQPTIDYDEDRDVQLFKDTPDVWLSCKSNTFAIFFPEDAHMPMISSGELHKVVVKVAV